MTYDTSSGSYKVTKIGKKRKLTKIPGYKWQNSDGTELEEIECKIKEFGIMEFMGEEEYHELEDVDECQLEHMPCPMKNAKCVNLPGSYYCDCNDGYSLLDNSNCQYGKFYY